MSTQTQTQNLVYKPSSPTHSNKQTAKHTLETSADAASGVKSATAQTRNIKDAAERDLEFCQNQKTQIPAKQKLES